MKINRHILFLASLLTAILMEPPSSLASGSTVIDNASTPGRALITFPEYNVSPPGKWTIVVVDQKKLRFRSLDGAQNMQVGTFDLHPKPKQGEDDAFHSYVDNRRQQEQENIASSVLRADPIDYSSDTRGQIASWCIVDEAGASGHLTAILKNKHKLLIVSYDADKVNEDEFRKFAAMVLSSMALR